MSVVAGLSLAGVLASVVILDSFDSLSFEAFVVTVLMLNLWQEAYVVIDHCSIDKINRDDATREWIKVARACLVHLSSYWPDLWPVEIFCQKLKFIFKTLEAQTIKTI